MAAALVDGTLEVHDFQSIISTNGGDKSQANDEDSHSDDDDEDDTILSSTHLHTQLIPNTAKPAADKNNSESKYAVKKASCRAVQFSNHNGHRLYTGGSAGALDKRNNKAGSVRRHQA